MDKGTNSDVVAKRAALELRPLAAYLDDHDAGRVPANAEIYQIASQKVKVLLAPHIANPDIQRLCHKSQSLHEILGNILIELEPGMAQDLARALEEAKVTAYWLQ
jgi:hypothetical protein